MAWYSDVEFPLHKVNLDPQVIPETFANIPLCGFAGVFPPNHRWFWFHQNTALIYATAAGPAAVCVPAFEPGRGPIGPSADPDDYVILDEKDTVWVFDEILLQLPVTLRTEYCLVSIGDLRTRAETRIIRRRKSMLDYCARLMGVTEPAPSVPSVLGPDPDAEKRRQTAFFFGPRWHGGLR